MLIGTPFTSRRCGIQNRAVGRQDTRTHGWSARASMRRDRSASCAAGRVGARGGIERTRVAGTRIEPQRNDHALVVEREILFARQLIARPPRAEGQCPVFVERVHTLRIGRVRVPSRIASDTGGLSPRRTGSRARRGCSHCPPLDHSRRTDADPANARRHADARLRKQAPCCRLHAQFQNASPMFRSTCGNASSAASECRALRDHWRRVPPHTELG